MTSPTEHPAALPQSKRGYWFAIALALMLFIGYLDLITGYELSFSIFYVLPISLATWRVGSKTGHFLSVLSALTWLVVDISSGHRFSSYLIPFWNTAVRLAFFTVICTLLSQLRYHLAHEEALARKDSLTGIMNSRFFREEAARIVNLAGRNGRPFTICYMDVDNFKSVNDSRGHREGDRLLREIAAVLNRSTRSYDCVARIGGDEFAVLLVESGQDEARRYIDLLRGNLQNLAGQNHWPISFSMGVVTFTATPESVDQAISLADQVMYRVKNSTKNDTIFELWMGGVAKS